MTFSTLLTALAVAAAQPNFAAYTPEVAFVRIADGTGPTIDGDLSDPAWARAGVVDEFYQVEPAEGAAPSERTQVLVMYDSRALYIAGRMFDSRPVTATVQARDGDVFKDDTLKVILDPYLTGRDAIFFQVNPLGARLEISVENNGNPSVAWNIIWDADARIDDDGWTVEMMIPFQSISFDPNADAWGFQLVREIKSRNEVIRWSSINQSVNDINVQRIGRARGIEGADQGLELDAQVFGTLQAVRDWERPRDDDVTFQPSGNVFYKFTPSLTGTLTFNTDFSDTPLDARQVNTDRFSLFFPEVRDFFLQDSQVFAFGGRNFAGGGGVNGSPFFSRRIGIVDGAPSDIIAGAKLSGTLGRFNLGGLTTLTEGVGGADDQVLSTVRASAEVLGDSRAGFIVTNGDPTGDTKNTLVGADFLYRRSVFGDQTLFADAFVATTLSDQDSDEGESYGAEIAYPNDLTFWRLQYKHVGENFDPKLGFVNRPGTNKLGWTFRKRRRPGSGPLRLYSAGTYGNLFRDLDGVVESREAGIWIDATNNIGDRAEIGATLERENVRTPFMLPGGVLVPAGDYSFARSYVQFDTSSSRRIQASFGVSGADWFGDGERLSFNGSINARLSRYFELTWSHNYSDIDLPTGSVDIHVSSIDANVNVTPNMQFASQIQYDNISEQLGYFGRFKWEMRPETEIFLSLSHAATTDFERFRSNQTGAVVRVGNTFRF